MEHAQALTLVSKMRVAAQNEKLTAFGRVDMNALREACLQFGVTAKINNPAPKSIAPVLDALADRLGATTPAFVPEPTQEEVEAAILNSVESLRIPTGLKRKLKSIDLGTVDALNAYLDSGGRFDSVPGIGGNGQKKIVKALGKTLVDNELVDAIPDQDIPDAPELTEV